MGNSHPSQNSRSFSDDMIGHGPIKQRPHASSEVLPYNYQHNTNSNHHTSYNTKPIFSPKHHYNHINGNNIGPNIFNKTSPKLENNNASYASDSSITISRNHSEPINTLNNYIIIEGWLTKRGEQSKKLKKRYYKLYSNGKLLYNTKQNGSFKKYADLKVGIDNMNLKNDLGFEVNVAKRHLTFFANNKNERDQWFAMIYKHYYEKGKAKVKLLAKSSTDKDKFKNEKKDTFIMKENKKNNKKPRKKKKNGRHNSFDSTKAVIKNNNKNKNNTMARPAMTPPVTKKRSQSTVSYKNGHKGDGMIIFSEQYISQECDGKTCLGLERVHYVLKKYDLWIGKENKIRSLGMYKYINNGLGEFYNNTNLLNDFNHLISYHDNIFNHIYEYFSGECNVETCLLIKRLHRDKNYYKNDLKRQQIYYNYNDIKEINTQQILDKIHCYYRHNYDLGFRVKKSKLLSIANNARNHRKWRTSSMNNMLKGKKQISITNEESKEAQMIIMQNDTHTDADDDDEINNNKSNDDIDDDDDGEIEDPNGFEDEWKLLEICGLIQQKRWNLTCLRGTDRMNWNKFTSTVSKSHRYHYWQKYDDDDDKEWIIEAKYLDFKTEILSNNLYFISLKQWECLNEKATNHFNMNKSKKIRPHKYWAELYNLPKDSQGSFSITKSHLIAIILYCNFDMLQRIFAETFYKLNENETNSELKKRHSNLYHFGRLLRQLIECFGKKIYNKNIVFYHGITDNIMFIETSMYFHAPLSTTTSIQVAIAYAQHQSTNTNNDESITNKNNDLLLELMDDDSVLGMARYFDCVWLSDFAGECEKFFIGGYKPLKINTVLDATLGRNYINYLKALHIIDEMMQGYYFDTENEEIKQIIIRLLQEQITNHKKKMSQKTIINKELLNEIKALNNENEPKIKMYMGALNDEIEQDYDTNKLMDEMKQNNNNEMDENDNDIHKRQISRKISEQFTFAHTRALSTIDMEEYDYFNEIPKYITNLVDYYCENVTNIVIDWTNMTDAYISKLLCINDNTYEWIKLNTFLTLFPNLKELNVRNIKLSDCTIKDIHKFLSKAKENNKYNQLYRIEIFEVDQTEYPISKCLNEYLEKFKDVGWTITFNPFEDEMCILKIKI